MQTVHGDYGSGRMKWTPDDMHDARDYRASNMLWAWFCLDQSVDIRSMDYMRIMSEAMTKYQWDD